MKNPSKLSSTILKSVSVRVLIVILVSSTLSYFHLYKTIERGSKDTLQKYVGERVKREEALFLLAQKNHNIIKAELVKQLAKKPSAEEFKRFDFLLKKYPDGTTRNRKEIYDGRNSAGVYIPKEVKITNELKHRIIVMIDISETYGKAFRNSFQDTYFTTSENIMVLFWPEIPNWTLEIKPDFNMLKEEYFWVADHAHDPLRKSVWTGVFYDKVSKTWMASLETPVDGPFGSITIGHDVMLDEFVSRVSEEHLEGTYNIIFREDGTLITHPTLLPQIKQNEGRLNLQETNDEQLKKIFKEVINFPEAKSGNTILIHDSKLQDILAFSKIGGPNWFFVTIFPKSLIISTALSGISFIIILALASLAFEIAFLYFGLKRDVIEPLRKLEESVTKISRGEYQSRLVVDRTDELGQLAESFNLMGQQIYDNERLLLHKVEERTKKVDEQRIALIQKSKLASLGQMAGGIAHEINTPLAIIGLKIEEIAEIVEEENFKADDLKHSLTVIKDTTDRIAKIVSGLRFISRDGSQLPMEKANLNAIIDETLNFCSEQLRQRNVDLEIIRNHSEDLTLECRSVEISQVLLNLLNNSSDAVMSCNVKWIKIVTNEQGHEIKISIIDSGPGIPVEIQEKIMQPFFTTKEVGKGTGLGLSISQGIIQSHRGSFYIDVESENTKFSIVLPKDIG